MLKKKLKLAPHLKETIFNSDNYKWSVLTRHNTLTGLETGMHSKPLLIIVHSRDFDF